MVSPLLSSIAEPLAPYLSAEPGGRMLYVNPLDGDQTILSVEHLRQIELLVCVAPRLHAYVDAFRARNNMGPTNPVVATLSPPLNLDCCTPVSRVLNRFDRGEVVNSLLPRFNLGKPRRGHAQRVVYDIVDRDGWSATVIDEKTVYVEAGPSYFTDLPDPAPYIRAADTVVVRHHYRAWDAGLAHLAACGARVLITRKPVYNSIAADVGTLVDQDTSRSEILSLIDSDQVPNTAEAAEVGRAIRENPNYSVANHRTVAAHILGVATSS